jgi:hypothetical protein
MVDVVVVILIDVIDREGMLLLQSILYREISILFLVVTVVNEVVHQ